MEKRTTDSIVIKLLAAKGSLEQASNFASHTIEKVKKLDPISKFRVLQLHREIKNLQEAKGTMNTSTAGSLARVALVRSSRTIPTLFPYSAIERTQPPLAVSFCHNCGTKITRTGAFCGSCGVQLPQ